MQGESCKSFFVCYFCYSLCYCLLHFICNNIRCLWCTLTTSLCNPWMCGVFTRSVKVNIVAILINGYAFFTKPVNCFHCKKDSFFLEWRLYGFIETWDLGFPRLSNDTCFVITVILWFVKYALLASLSFPKSFSDLLLTVLVSSLLISCPSELSPLSWASWLLTQRRHLDFPVGTSFIHFTNKRWTRDKIWATVFNWYVIDVIFIPV